MLEGSSGFKVVALSPLLLAVSLSLLSPFVLPTSTYLTIAPGFYFSSTTGGGLVSFGSTAYTLSWSFAYSTVVFNNLLISAYPATLGFAVSTGSNMTIQSLTASQLTYMTYTPPAGGATTKVYCGTKGEPESTTGGSMTYDPITRTATILVSYLAGGRLVTVTWPQSVPSQIAQGDISGWIIGIYSGVMGDMFFGLVLVAVFVPLYIRTQSIGFVALLWIIVGGLIELALPTSGMQIGKILLILGVAVMLYKLFIRER